MYEKKISTENPGLIVFVLDDSGSTADSFPGTTDPVCKWIERYFGIVVKELLARSTDVQGDKAVVRHRYYVLVIIYGSEPIIWNGGIMDIETAIHHYAAADNSLGLGGHLGGTDAKAAFEKAHAIVEQAIADGRFAESFPAMFFHLTDGQSHSDATQAADQIKKLATADGNAIVVNAFIGTKTNLQYKSPEDFPGYLTAEEAGPSDDNVQLFNMSSEMPETITRNLINDAIFPNLRDGARLFFDVRSKEQLKNVIQVVGSIGSRAQRR